MIIAFLVTVSTHGNEVKLRSAHLGSGARQCMIDYETTLPSSTLRNFFMHVHHVPDHVTSKIDLQIWRPEVMELNYKLVWSSTVTVKVNRKGGSKFQVN